MKAVAAVVACALGLSSIAQLSTGGAGGPQTVSPTVNALRQDLAAGKPGALDAFWSGARASGTPLVEPAPDDPSSRLVTFLWRGDPDLHAVLLKFRGNSQLTTRAGIEDGQLRHLAADVWYRTYRLPADARFTYELSPGDPLTLLTEIEPARRADRLAGFRNDPLNPKTADRQSVVSLPDAPPDPAALPAAPLRGRQETRTFRSARSGAEWHVVVYLPPAARPRALLVALDGDTYASDLMLPRILDTEIAQGRLPATAAVMVTGNPATRIDDLHYSVPFADALAGEVLPWVEKEFGLRVPAARTAIAGSSLGGGAALWIAFRHPERFGAVLSQSGGFQNRARPAGERLQRARAPDELFEPGFPESEWLTGEIARAPRRPLRIVLQVGRFEDLTEDWHPPAPLYASPSLLLATRHLRDVLVARGYPCDYQELSGAHEPASWRPNLARGLQALLTPATRSAD